MKCHKAQNWNGYQEYSTFGNSYILRWSSKNVWIGIYSVWLVAIDTYPEVVKKMYFLLLLLPGITITITR